jgi:hypothetical protein
MSSQRDHTRVRINSTDVKKIGFSTVRAWMHACDTYPSCNKARQSFATDVDKFYQDRLTLLRNEIRPEWTRAGKIYENKVKNVSREFTYTYPAQEVPKVPPKTPSVISFTPDVSTPVREYANRKLYQDLLQSQNPVTNEELVFKVQCAMTEVGCVMQRLKRPALVSVTLAPSAEHEDSSMPVASSAEHEGAPSSSRSSTTVTPQTVMNSLASREHTNNNSSISDISDSRQPSSTIGSSNTTANESHSLDTLSFEELNISSGHEDDSENDTSSTQTTSSIHTSITASTTAPVVESPFFESMKTTSTYINVILEKDARHRALTAEKTLNQIRDIVKEDSVSAEDKVRQISLLL